MAGRQTRHEQDGAVSVTRSWKLSPSDFAFLWEECRRCFHLKVARGHARPASPFPKIFTLIDSHMKSHFMGKRTEAFSAAMPPGVFAHAGKWVESRPHASPGRGTSCYVKGTFDTVLALDDGTFAVVDFKTASPKSSHTALYARQLHAYAWALENPAARGFAAAPVSRLGLLCFEPTSFSREGENAARYDGGLTWVEIPRDDAAFRGFLDEVLGVLELDEPPEADPSCGWCAYRQRVRGMTD